MLADLLDELGRRGIRLGRSGDTLRLRGDVQTLPTRLVEALRERKQEILDLLALADKRAVRPGESPASELYEASFGQARLYFLDRLRPFSAAYNVAASLLIHGDCDIDALREALLWTVRRHPALRTAFVEEDGKLLAVVSQECNQELELVDLSTCKGRDLRAAVRERRRKIACYGFDLTKPPLWRWELLHLGPGRHELVVAIHHSVADGWSLARAVRELGSAYRALNAGERPSAPPPRSDYADYARWQREWLAGEAGRRDLEFWRRRIEGFEAPIRLRTDRPRPVLQSDRGGRVAFSLPPATADSVRRFARAGKVTVSTVLMAAFAALLHRCSDSRRFLLGTAVANRPTSGALEVFGFFVNWLPLPFSINGGLSFAELTAQTQDLLTAALEHQNTPFDSIVREVGPPPDPSRHPLFQTMFVSHVPARRVRFGEVEVSLEPLPTETAKLDLTFFMPDSAEALPIAGQGDIFMEAEFNADLFNESTVQRMCGHYVRLVDSLLGEPRRALGTAPMLSDKERRTVLTEWNQLPRPSSASVVDLIGETARRHARSPAVSGAGLTLDYAALWREAGLVAGTLTELGISAGDRVGVHLERTPESIVVVLGILLRGAAYVPLDPIYPRERLRQVALHSELAAIITQPSRLEEAGGLAPGVPVWAFERERLKDRRFTPPPVPPETPAYLIHTSGSTGKPKGVLCSQGQVASFITWLNLYLNCGTGDRVLFKAPLGFDASIREFLAPLACGAEVVVAPDSPFTDPDELNRLLGEAGVTILHCVPSLYKAMIRSRNFEGPKLRHVVCGGEALPESLASAHLNRSGAVLHNVYGPTECTVDVTAWRIEGTAGRDSCPIGRPIPGAMVYVADPNLEPVPVGAVGEIIIAGTPVGQGYWRDPEETARRFGRSPLPEWEGVPIYRTGDLGRFLEDGVLLFEGRLDRQCKIHGYRIEPEEVESALLGQRGVEGAAVTVGPLGSDERALLAFVQLAEGSSPTRTDERASGLAEALAERLPFFMVPRRIEILDRLPRLPNGKIDRSALPRIERVAASDNRGAALPDGDQRTVAEIMGGLLGRPINASNDHFFFLGGHSLMAVQLVARLARETGVQFAVRDIFENPTVSGLAALLAQRRGKSASSVDAIRPIPRPARGPERRTGG